VGRRDWLFTAADLADFLARRRFEPRTAIGSKPKKGAAAK
jgi:hypothetical protein